MPEEKSNIAETKKELLEAYKKHLDEIFSPETFNLSFDERENLIHGKMKKETTNVMENHVEKDPKGISNEPAETCLCICGTEAMLYRDKNGDPRIFERKIKTKSGQVTIKEYGYYCSKDRKIFFPSPKNT